MVKMRDRGPLGSWQGTAGSMAVTCESRNTCSHCSAGSGGHRGLGMALQRRLSVPLACPGLQEQQAHACCLQVSDADLVSRCVALPPRVAPT